MQAEFWHQRWQDNKIAFHEKRGNHLLAEHFDRVGLAQASRVFVPLCGKTLDIGWLLSKGCQVAGAELSETAIEQLFDELDITPEISTNGPLKHYRCPNLDMFVGDIFDLSCEVLGPVNASYDRAALVALPDAMRESYVEHLTQLTARAPQLLICFEYDQTQMDGPPFSIDAAQVARHYEHRYHIELVGQREVPGGLKGKVSAKESAWYLRRRD